MSQFSLITMRLFLFAIAAASGIAPADLLGATPDQIQAIKAPFPMPQLQRPLIPSRVCNLQDFGAIEGGFINNRQAFNKAIEACAKAGGGHVLVPPGKWMTGAIQLKSNVDLHLEKGSEVIFSDCFEDYLPTVFVRMGGIEAFNYSPLIYARDCQNISITGAGYLNGNGQTWWSWAKKESPKLISDGANGVGVESRIFGTPGDALRPSFISFVSCTNVLLEGFGIGSGPNWTIHPVYCENVIVRKVTVDTHGPNNDGIDPDSCKNVLIEHCAFSTGDDCVVLKSGYNEDGWRVGKPTENVIVRYCSGKKGHGGLVIGSEMSGGVRNVYMYDCYFDGTDRAVRIKSKLGRGGFVENVWVENVRAKNLHNEAIVLNMDYSFDVQSDTNGRPPIFRNMHFSNIAVDGALVAVRLVGLDKSPIQDISFRKISINSEQGVVGSYVRNVRFIDTKIHAIQRPRFNFTDSAGVLIKPSDF